MKHTSRNKKSFLWQALVASTLITVVSAPSVYALVDLTVSGKTSDDAGFDPATGYNFKADGISFTVTDGDNIGVTAGISVDNNNGVPATPFVASTLNFAGSSLVTGTVGPTNAVETINLQGAGGTVRFAGDVTLSKGIVMSADGTVVFADGVDLIAGSIDNTAGAGKGKIEFEGSTVTHGSIGNTNPFLLITENSNGGASKTGTFEGPVIKATTFFINDNGVAGQGSTLLFNNAIGQVTGNITAKTNNLDTVNFLDTVSMTGNIGTGATALAKVMVGATDDLAMSGNIFATLTQFQDDNTLTLADTNIITGNVDTTGAGKGTLEFLGGGGVTGTIGATNAINTVLLDAAGKTVSLGGNTKVTNGVNFSGASDTTSVLNIADGVTITGNLDNKTLAIAGIVNFKGDGGVTGTTGATKAINTINLNGTAGEIVYLQGDVTVGPGNLNFAAGSTPTSVLRLGDTVDVTGNIDNITGVAGNGTVTFDDDGSVSGTIGATKSLNIINLNGAGTVEFDGNVTANVTNISANGLAKYADNVIVTGAIDNTSGVVNKGRVEFVGSGQVTGNMGNTNSLQALNINTGLGANEVVELNGAIMKIGTTTVFDDGATPTTLTLNNAAMAFTGNIIASANDLDILNVLNAATITGQIGAVGNEFNLMKVAQNGNTTVNGDIFANTVEFNGNNTLTLADGSDINGNVTTTADNQGILALQGNSKITGTIGSAPLRLNAINLLGLNKTLTIGNDTFVNNINIANDGEVIIADNADFTGNINNTSGVDSKGKLTFQGTGSVAGNIGASNTLNLITVNSLAGANEVVTLSGNVVRATNINVNDNVVTPTTLKLDNAAMILSTGIITPTTNNIDILDINQAAIVNAQIGAGPLNNFALIKVAAIGNTIINGDIFAANTQFQADNKLILTDGSDVTGNITTVNPNFGILELRGDHTITGTVDAGTINVTGIGKTVNFKQSVTPGIGNLNFAPAATCATTMNFADNANVNGNIDNLTLSGSAGTLNFAGSSIVTGTIGATSPICKINLNGAGELVQFQKSVTVGSGNINFNQDLELQIGLPGTTANVTGNIDNFSGLPNKGTLTFLGSSTMNGAIGLSNPLLQVNLDGPAGDTVNFINNINAQKLTFTDNGNATLASGIIVTGPITTTVASQGNLHFLGNFNVNNKIGDVLPLNSINVDGPAGTTVSLFQNINATNTNVTNGGTLLGAAPVTIGGNVNLTAGTGSTLAVAANGAPLTITGDLNVPAGTTMSFDLNSVNIPTYIKVNNAAFIDANSTVVLTNTPQAYAAGNYDIKLVDATNLGAIAVPNNVIGDSLLLTFELEALNAPFNDLLLHIDVLPASLFADRINTIGVAGALDSMAGKDFGGRLQLLLDQLPFFTTQEQLNDALAALAPIVDNSYTQEAFAAQQLGYGAVSDRLRHVRQRKVIPGIKAPFDTGISSGDDLDENGHGRWFKLYGQYSDQNEMERVAGYNAETWGLAIGSDVSLNDLNLIGVSANLSHTYIGHDVSDSKTSLYSLQGAIYGEQDFCEWFYLNWVTSVAYNKYTTERSFLFGLLPLSPQDDFVGWQFGAKGEFGYEYIYNGYHIIPNTSLYYSYLALGGYNESGADNASQSVDSQHYSMLKGGAGVRAGYTCPYNMGDSRSIIFQPEVRFNLFYDFINDNMATTSQFTGGGPSFVTVGPTPAPTSFNVGASLSIFSDFSNYIVTMSYDYETKDNYTANAGFLRMRYEW
jgi:uncharacterized protein with beta-barrel porin domain